MYRGWRAALRPRPPLVLSKFHVLYQTSARERIELGRVAVGVGGRSLEEGAGGEGLVK